MKFGGLARSEESIPSRRSDRLHYQSFQLARLVSPTSRETVDIHVHALLLALEKAYDGKSKA